ncbi:MAG TPA: DEAD/DEAH box helicase [Candidatus Corynebacterium avicola]|uniref:RNA helicase n=1 Tax=Candidatus Corynebacterium avicola TaxID=2838527 RepID=A0A9D1UMB0_9CORY|nr:DEAD/DEAH box helicase [Candidatus Corynebacterium avicola]
MHDLPFAAGRDDLLTALRSRGVAVVQAPPGTGKTTLAPQYVLEHVRATSTSGRVVVTQPRRVAARSSAARVAELRGGTVGDEVGYTVRGDRAVSASTAIEMVTPGVLLRRLLADPDLDGVAAVVIDEVHERHLESDLVFAMITQLRELRDDLAVVAMSATLDAARFAELLGGDGASPAPVVDVPSPIHPLDIHYATSAGSMVNRDRRHRSAVEDTVLATVRRALAETTGDFLVFVPTIRGTETVAAALNDTHLEAFALHGRLSPGEQARIVRGHGRSDTRRVIVATDVAESSLTVPGVRVVVDACLARVSRRDSTRGMSVLVTETASQSSMTQRAGRAGREGPGTVYRCITAEQYAKAPASSPPAVLTSDLTSALLDVACWGSPRGDDLPLPDAFPTLAADAAETTLQSIGAVDDAGAVTSYGRELARIPADPRLARGGLLAAERVDATTVAKVLAVLDDGSGRLDNLPDARDPVVSRFRKLLGSTDKSTIELRGTDAVAYTLACAFPGLIARRVEGDRFLTVSGTGAVLQRGSVSVPNNAEWIAVADIAGASTTSTGGTGAMIRDAVTLTQELAFEAASPLLSDAVTCTWTPGGAAGKFSARRVRALGAIELSSTPVSAKDITSSDREAAVRKGLDRHGLGALNWSENASELRRRIQYLHNNSVGDYPSVADAEHAAQLMDFVVPDLVAGKRPDLAGLLRGLVPWDRRLETDAPETLDLPAGRTVRIRYPEADSAPDAPAVVATKLQDCFGMHESPEIAGRKIQFQLLSPAQRPLAVTDDLASFWSGPYQQVRSEMRGRYPKHPWPEDP